MTIVAPIRLQYDPKVLWFDPGDLEIHTGDPVIVETARGLEYGEAAGELTEIPDEAIEELKSPLKPVLRIATEEDDAQRWEMRRLSYEALPIFKEIARETNENMHPVMVEYLFDGTKAIFLFESEERNDFRELVRRLTAKLHVRVDMRQIGVRDGARIIGGLGHCGQELCCCRLGGEFCPVSIRMAKAQDLSLNPQQISGVCGRLMCCLRYEYDTYKDFKARAPKANATVATPEGPMKVCELDTPHEVVVLRNEEGKRFRIPLAEFDEPEEGMNRPKSIGDKFYDYANKESEIVITASFGDTGTFTVEDKLAEEGQIHHNKIRRVETVVEPEEEPVEDKRPGSTLRRRRRIRNKVATVTATADEAAVEAAPEVAPAKKAEPQRKADPAKESAKEAKAQAEEKPATNSRRRRRRSGKGKEAAPAQAAAPASPTKQAQSKESKAASKQTAQSKAPAGTAHRRARRRSHRTGGDSSES